MTLTDKQKEAIGAMLELYKGGSITSETAMTVIEAVFEGSASVQYIPFTRDRGRYGDAMEVVGL